MRDIVDGKVRAKGLKLIVEKFLSNNKSNKKTNREGPHPSDSRDIFEGVNSVINKMGNTSFLFVPHKPDKIRAIKELVTI